MSCAESSEDTPVEKLIVSIEKQLKVKDDQLRKANELLDRYVNMLENKDKRIQELFESLMEMTDRAVQYPAKSHQTPMLCVAREFNCVRAITGQKVHVAKMKRELAGAAEVSLILCGPTHKWILTTSSIAWKPSSVTECAPATSVAWCSKPKMTPSQWQPCANRYWPKGVGFATSRVYNAPPIQFRSCHVSYGQRIVRAGRIRVADTVLCCNAGNVLHRGTFGVGAGRQAHH
ncbi:baculovirus repeated ORF [Antheraea proylei nucleopolyhedrovirus]|uniref:Bro-a n=1 Tax=Antheraea proylei nucleopolyhedrovirus TaxID=2126611 RepID=A0A3G5EAW8_NPVAP|nr:baculovirus repeated ORF [Antheraea proylei nucleopolyhedrovirus]AYW35386.1 bro-a [Antheraea proylei nucleopolyhedrovirus]